MVDNGSLGNLDYTNTNISNPLDSLSGRLKYSFYALIVGAISAMIVFGFTDVMQSIFGFNAVTLMVIKFLPVAIILGAIISMWNSFN